MPINTKIYDLWDALSDDEFRAEAYSDYLQDCANSYNNLVMCMTDALDDSFDIDEAAVQYCEDHELEITPENIEYAINVIVNDDTTITSRAQVVLDRYGVTGRCPVSFNSGYSTALDTIKTIIKQSDLSSLNSGQSNIDAISDKVLALTDINGDALDPIDVSTAINEGKSALHSAVCASACAIASKATTAADRITVFTDKVQGVFQNAYANISGSLQYYKNLLSDVTSDCKTICSRLNEAMNLTQLAQGSTITTIASTDISEFSGASPVPALDYSSATKAIGSVLSLTAKAVAVAVSGTVSTLWTKLVRPSLFKAASKTYNLVNPYDVGILNNNATSPTVDGWCIETKNQILTIPAAGIAAFNTHHGTNFTVDDWYNVLRGSEGQWIKMDSILGEVLLSITSVWKGGVDNEDCEITFTSQLKPKPLNCASMMASALAGSSSSNYMYAQTSGPTAAGSDNFGVLCRVDNSHSDNTETITSNIANWKSANSSNMYTQIVELTNEYQDIIPANNERDLYLSFLQSVLSFKILDRYTLRYLDKIYLGNAIYPIDQNYSVIFAEAADGTSLDPITNKQFVSVVSGWDGNTSNPSFDIDSIQIPNLYATDNAQAFGFMSFGSGLMLMYAAQRMIRDYNPLSYPFFPYRNSTANFNASIYYIKTDTQNQKALTSYLTNVTIATIAAVVAITIGVSIVSYSRAKLFKRMEYLGQMDNAMWNGEHLTADQRNKYLRYQRKLGLSQSGSSGLTSSLSGIFTDFSDAKTDPESTIVHLITG